MKTRIFTLCACMFLSFTTLSAAHKDNKKAEVTYLVSMSCEKCQKRIESNIPFEKGVTDLEVNLEKKLVTIEYRTDKTNPEKLKAALKKMGYTVMPFKATGKKEADKK